MKFVTSLNKKLWDDYGQKTVESMVKNLPGELLIYSEDPLPGTQNIDLCINTRLNDFKAMVEKLDVAHGNVQGNYQYRWDAVKFAHKAFAIHHATMNTDELVFWLDADVMVDKPAPASYFEGLCKDTYVTFLGRSHYPHSECGFIGFDTSAQYHKAFMENYMRLYLEGTLLLLPGWTDCDAFDFVRVRVVPEDQQNNLSEGITDDIDVWPQTSLSQYMRHFKGARKKVLAA